MHALSSSLSFRATLFTPLLSIVSIGLFVWGSIFHYILSFFWSWRKQKKQNEYQNHVTSNSTHHFKPFLPLLFLFLCECMFIFHIQSPCGVPLVQLVDLANHAQSPPSAHVKVVTQDAHNTNIEDNYGKRRKRKNEHERMRYREERCGKKERRRNRKQDARQERACRRPYSRCTGYTTNTTSKKEYQAPLLSTRPSPFLSSSACFWVLQKGNGKRKGKGYFFCF